MDVRDIFGIVVRTAGLAAIVHGMPGLQGMFNPPDEYTRMNYFVGYGGEIVLGLILLFGADFIVWFSYRNSRLFHENRQS